MPPKNRKKKHEIKLQVKPSISSPSEEPVQDLPSANVALNEEEKVDSAFFGKRQIVSNWKKYEPIEDPEESRPADFQELLKQTVSVGGHFKMKSEKAWETPEGLECGEIFSLDLNMLCKGLACIPFYKRFDLDADLFTEEEIKQQNAVAKKVSAEYKEYLKAKGKTGAKTKTKTKIQTETEKQCREELELSQDVEGTWTEKPTEAVAVVQTPSKPTKLEIPVVCTSDEKSRTSIAATVEDDELDELLNIKISNSAQIASAPNTMIKNNVPCIPKSDVDLEQWLEDILDS